MNFSNISDSRKFNMTIEGKVASDNSKIHIKKILVPIDGSEYSLNATRYAIRIAKGEDAQLFCIHIIVSIPYGYATGASAADQYFNDVEVKVQSWFDRDMAKQEPIPELKTEIFRDVKLVIASILDYASSRDIDLIVIRDMNDQRIVQRIVVENGGSPDRVNRNPTFF